MIYDIYVNEDRVIGGLTERSTIIQHNIGVDYICPHFYEEWEGFSISAIFKKPATAKREELKFSLVVVDNQNTVIPWELLEDTDDIELTFVGIKDDTRLVTLYTGAALHVLPSGELTGATPKSPTVDQIEALVSELQDTVDEAKQTVTGIQDVIEQGEQAVESANQAVTDAQAALETANSASEAANSAATEASEAATKANEAAERVDTSIDGATNATEAANQATEAANAATQSATEAAEAANTAASNASSTDESVKAAEALRVTAEETRTANETERVDKEAERQAAEKLRVEAETGRAEAEEGRVSAETKRAEDHAQHNKDQEANNLAQAKNNADQANNNAAAMGLQFQILQEGEYDPETLTPTIEGAAGKFYLVPYGKGEGSDLYAEWIWVDQESRFERVGNTSMSAEPITTDQIDQIVSGFSVTSENLLNGTGLSYYNTALKAVNDVLYDQTGAASEVESKLTEYQATQATKDAAQDKALEDGLAIKADKTELEDYATKTYCDEAIKTAVGDAMEASY